MQDGDNIPRGLVKIAQPATDKGILMPPAEQSPKLRHLKQFSMQYVRAFKERRNGYAL